MLKQITFKNWKSFDEAVLYIDPFTALIGTNASGKSNLLDGIEFLRRIAVGIDTQTALEGGKELPPIRGEESWGIPLYYHHPVHIYAIIQGKSAYTEYVYELTIDSGAILAEHVLCREYNPTTKQISDTKVLLHVSERVESPAISKLGRLTLSQEIPEALIHVSNVFTHIFAVDPIPSRMRSFSRLSHTLRSDASNIAGVLANLHPEQKVSLEQTLARYVTQLPEGDIKRVWAESVGKLKTDAMLYCEEQWSPNQPPMVVDARGMSDGTLRFLAILTTLLTLPPHSLVAIEDVDNGLHPSRARLLLQMVQDIGTQRHIDVLVTTHNPSFIDAFLPELLPFVMVVHRDMQTGYSRISPLEEIEQLPKLLASGTLGQIAGRGAIERSLQMEHKGDMA